MVRYKSGFSASSLCFKINTTLYVVFFFISIFQMMTVQPSRYLLALFLVQLGFVFFSLCELILRQAHVVSWLWLLCSISSLIALFCVLHLWRRQAAYCLHPSLKKGLTYVANSGRASERDSLSLHHITDRIAWDFLLAFRAVSEDGITRRFLILKDSLPPEDFRRLRVFLRWRSR